MKKIYTLLATALTLTSGLFAQTIVFSEDFDNIGGPTAGGPGTYTFPASWSLFNVDGLTPAANVSYVTDAWIRREDLNNAVDSCAISTSWYAPVASSDDWMFTPAITALPAGATLTWNALTYDPAYSDGYEVRIMTTAPNTGNITTSTVLFTQAVEANVWTPYSVSLAAYVGQTVYIGFRNNSYDKYLLAIDDIEVIVPNNYDARITSADSLNDYTQIPLAHTHPVNLSATVNNNGLLAVTNVVLTAQVKNSSNAVVHTASSSALALLASGASSTLSMAPFIAGASETYHVDYAVTIAETDGSPANNIYVGTDYLMVTDTVYARDRDTATGFLGIGAGVGGYLGQEFVLAQPSTLTSVSGFINRPYPSYNVSFAIFDFAGPLPGTTPIATTDTVNLVSGAAAWLTLSINGPALVLPAGKFMVAVVEHDSIAQIGQSANNFVTGTTWVDWTGSPAGGWANNEFYGAAFAKPYMLRANFGGLVSVPENQTSTSLDVTILPNPNNGQFTLNYNFTDATDATITVFNVLGEVVQTKMLNNVTVGVQAIDLGNVASGQYMVQVVTDAGVNTTTITVE